jgi:hypothetical protein
VKFRPYTAYTVLSTIQLLMFTALAFYLALGRLAPKPLVSLDTDWFYRKGGALFVEACMGVARLRSHAQESMARLVRWTTRQAQNPIQAADRLILRNSGPIAPYDASRHRHAIGLGVMYFLILFSLLSVVFLAYR